jgi:hypothetical protein
LLRFAYILKQRSLLGAARKNQPRGDFAGIQIVDRNALGDNRVVYAFMLENKLATLCFAFAIACLASFIVGNWRQAPRMIAFSYGPAFACAFFLIGFFYGGSVSSLDLASGFLFEFAVLIAYAKFFKEALRQSNRIELPSVEYAMKASLMLQLLIAIPLATSEGFGIFSDGSRIAYLDDGASAKFLTYAVVPLAAVQAGLIARRVSLVRSPGMTGYAVMVLAFILSTLSGSKGAVFLWLVSIAAMIDYRGLRIRWVPISVGLMGLTTALSTTVILGAEALGISEAEFAELAAARFFLNNDARAFALDFGGAVGSHAELLAASFRALSTRLGHPPTDPPLGLVLYEHYFGVSTGNGPNASLIALITYYAPRGYALLSALIACVAVAVVYLAVYAFQRFIHGAIQKMSVALIGTILIQQFSQDFLAFPLLVTVACAGGCIFLLTDRKYPGASIRRLRHRARPTHPQHHHSSTSA